MILYTTQETGYFIELPFRTSHQKLMKHLYKHRNSFKNESETREIFFSLIPQPGMNPTLQVFAIAFIKNGKVQKVWDAYHNGYRLMPKRKLSILESRPRKNPRLYYF
jgi:hypothetical protein